MAESIIIDSTIGKAEKYESLLPQIAALVATENNLIANLSNVSAALKEAFNFFWVGFYLKDETELVLGPFQGPVACTRIKIGKGVCGIAFMKAQTMLIPDVNQFEEHIFCNSFSQSEIVLPFYQKGELIGVLDIDSDQLAHFNEVDERYLIQILSLIDK